MEAANYTAAFTYCVGQSLLAPGPGATPKILENIATGIDANATVCLQ